MSDILHFLIKLCIDHVVFGVVYFIYADITVVVQKWEFGGKMCLIGINMTIQKDKMVLKLGFFSHMFPLQISQIIEFIQKTSRIYTYKCFCMQIPVHSTLYGVIHA